MQKMNVFFGSGSQVGLPFFMSADRGALIRPTEITVLPTEINVGSSQNRWKLHMEAGTIHL
jgi:hypothetical protein